MTNRERKDALESYSSLQLIYNLWSNEWHFCNYFGKSDDDDDDNDDGWGGGGNLGFNDPGDNEMAHAACITDCI
jgi:hypothetical protein